MMVMGKRTSRCSGRRTARGISLVRASQTFKTLNWGADGDLPVPADHDGDGKADLVVFRPSTNTWYTRFANGTFSTTAFGVAGDKPVVGDFDGDGKADIALYRSSDNNWYILKTGFGFFVQTWGVAGDIPVPADYDGDGKTDVAVFRPSTGQWFRIQSTAGFDTVNWGRERTISPSQRTTTETANRMSRCSGRRTARGTSSAQRPGKSSRTSVREATCRRKAAFIY